MSYYKLLKNDTKQIGTRTLYRIQATEDFKTPYRDVKKGELGGYVENYGTLTNNSWVFGNAKVFDCTMGHSSYIVGDHTYCGLFLNNGSIQGTGDYINKYGYNRIYDVDVIGHCIIKGSKHSVIWGVDKNNKEVTVIVGCQRYTIPEWKSHYKWISKSQGYQNDVKEYLGYLNRIEESLKPSNEKILEKISENISSMKMSVTEALKFETISLVNSLQVSTPIVQKGPARDKFGRFIKKGN